eukprot:GHVS01060752.1.p1 GENE.GHVS01060752.1~~GHVS01060752.1.p1  ORF type:complete len:595 (+),score=60.72 GHVS01060752.1:121-1905(+)
MFSADCFVTAMAAIVSPIGGVRLFPWIGVIVWLLLLQLAVADDDWKPTLLPVLTGLEFVDDLYAQPPKYNGSFFIMRCKVTDAVVINSMQVHGDRTTVDDLIDGFVIQWAADKSAWTRLMYDEQITGKLFSLFGVVQVEGEGAPPEVRQSRLHWVEATAVVRKAYEKGLILPLGFIKTKTMKGWGSVWPTFKGLKKYCGAGSAFNLNSWTADQVLKLANSVVELTMLLQKNNLSYGRLQASQILGTQPQTKFLLYSFDDTRVSGTPKQVFGSVPGKLVQTADSCLQLYEVGVMLASVPVAVQLMVAAVTVTDLWHEDLKRQFSMFSSESSQRMAKLADSYFGNDESESITAPLNVAVANYQKSLETVSLWLNIARFSRPYLFGEDLTFKRDSKEELGNDSASRLQTFCTLALVGVGEYRPTLEGAAKYLQDGTDVADLLKVDVPKYLIPYSLFLARQMEVEAPAHDSHKDCIFDKLSRVAKNLIEVGIRRNVDDYYKHTVERYTTAIDKMKDDGATAITQSKNESLRVALNVVHTFCFMFPDFIKYLTVEGLKAAGFLEVDAGGKDEYWNIPEETRTLLNRCNNKVLEQLVGKV